jgi:hypothetical protein
MQGQKKTQIMKTKVAEKIKTRKFHGINNNNNNNNNNKFLLT